MHEFGRLSVCSAYDWLLFVDYSKLAEFQQVPVARIASDDQTLTDYIGKNTAHVSPLVNSCPIAEKLNSLQKTKVRICCILFNEVEMLKFNFADLYWSQTCWLSLTTDNDVSLLKVFQLC